MSISSIEVADRRVAIVDQTCLPETLHWAAIADDRAMVEAIRALRIRGAPALGVAAAAGLALAAEALSGEAIPWDALNAAAQRLRSARPTAVNLGGAIDRALAVGRRAPSLPALKSALWDLVAAMIAEDLRVNRALGCHGADLVGPGRKVSVLTHCNTGSLATVQWGTALGIARELHARGQLAGVYACETRPLLQGARLTAWELAQDGIPVTVIADGAAAALMRQGRVDIVLVGADRVAANGDVANKIGTYALAIAARFHALPFYVAAPLATLDPATPAGEAIVIEERAAEEMTHLGMRRLVPAGVRVANPAFDVTPAALVGAIITEAGVIAGDLAAGIARLAAAAP
jgi:methylthioribose-1-phosphate isomerase